MQTTAAADVREYVVRDPLGRLALRGRILASCRWDKTNKPRWTDMVLYQVIDADSDYKYALEIIARSIVYHRADGPCVRKRQKLTTVAEVYTSPYRWEILMPCRRPDCRPGDLQDLSDNDRIAEEKDKHQLYLCDNAPDILNKLYKRQGEISELAAKLLHQAAIKDPAIAEAWKNTRRV